MNKIKKECNKSIYMVTIQSKILDYFNIFSLRLYRGILLKSGCYRYSFHKSANGAIR